MHAHTVLATRVSGHLGEVHAREVVVPVETRATAAAHDGALSPLELLLAAVAGGVLAGVEQAVARLAFRLGGAAVEVCGVFGGQTTSSLAVEYDLTLDTDESDGRLVQFHELVRHGDALVCLGSAGAHLTGRVRRHGAATVAANGGATPRPMAAPGVGGESAAAAAASPRR